MWTIRKQMGDNMAYLDEIFGVGGKTALVTGGATGIGRMIATALVEGGAKVLIASRKGEACIEAAAQLNALNAAGTAEGFAGDVGSEEAISSLAAEVGKRTDRLNILVNNAGVTWGKVLEKFPHQAWQKVMNVNVAGLFTLTRDLLPLLENAASADDPARVINLGSVMGTSPIGAGAYSYAASKAAVHHLTRIMASEFAPRHITANAFAPGPFKSNMTAFALDDEDRADSVAKTIPLGRLGAPEDVAGATLFLCGRGGGYITGTIIPLDGGMATDAPKTLFGD
jgi:NAD(P)-dependent dehydrogenase (short-subunit alcohol dehydrogenase family)